MGIEPNKIINNLSMIIHLAVVMNTLDQSLILKLHWNQTLYPHSTMSCSAVIFPTRSSFNNS